MSQLQQKQISSGAHHLSPLNSTNLILCLTFFSAAELPSFQGSTGYLSTLESPRFSFDATEDMICTASSQQHRHQYKLTESNCQNFNPIFLIQFNFCFPLPHIFQISNSSILMQMWISLQMNGSLPHLKAERERERGVVDGFQGA